MKDLIPTIIQALFSAGGLGAIYLLLKLRPEAGQITVTAAQGVVLMQSNVIDDLRKENKEFKEELKKMEEKFDEQELRFTNKLQAMQEENNSLRSRIRELERLERQAK